MLNITTPYPYKEFKRKSVNGKRLYENPYGDPVPSVTTILDKTKPKEKREALNRWKKRVGEANAQRIVTEAANVGTIMHNILEHWVKNEEYEGDSILQAKMMADTVKQNIEADIEEVWEMIAPARCPHNRCRLRPSHFCLLEWTQTRIT